MKNLLNRWIGGLAALAILVVFAAVAGARLTGTSTTDLWCMGTQGEEICLDVSGNLIPTTDSDTTLGSTTYRWATVHADDVTLDDDLVVGDDLTVTDDALISGDLTVTGATTLNGVATIGDAEADTLTVNVTTVVIRASINALHIATHTGTGSSQGILDIDSTNRRICVNCLGSEEPEDAAFNIRDDGLWVGTGGTPGITVGEDDIYAEGTVEVDGELQADGTLDANSTVLVDGAFTFNDDSADLDARFETDSMTHALYIDGGAEGVGINDSTPDAMLDIIARNASSSGTVITAAASQTADLLLIRDSSENDLVSVGEDGTVVLNESSADIDFRVESDNMSSALHVDASADGVGINDSTPDAMLDVIARTASSSGTVITGAASQTADLLQIRDSAENALVTVGEAGSVRIGYGATPDVTPGVDDLFVEGTVEIDGATRIDGAVDINAALGLYSRTKADLAGITPVAAGEIYYCSDCDNSVNAVVSTGTAISQFDSFGVGGTTFY